MFGLLLKERQTVVSADCVLNFSDNDEVQVEDETRLKSSTLAEELPPKSSLLSVKRLLQSFYTVQMCLSVDFIFFF